MRLVSLEIHGFKSFADSQKLIFPGGMTAVVGPNGCGKSNIADALAWVLGEQRASLLRGTEMLDVVFAGTSERKPMGMAEVKLVLEMQDFSRPGDADAVSEVTVSRRLFRDAGSEYRINGRDCRLKDVQDLLMDTGMGTRAYSFIQQGQIDQILSTKPKDRRQLLEEAAGITRYKARRTEAERRLEDARTNLQRLDDILFEKSKQQDSLKRQAARTRRALELDCAIKETQRILLAGKVMERETAKNDILQNLDVLESQIAQLTAQATEKASEVERRRLALDEQRRLQEQRIQKLGSIDHERDKLNQEKGFQELRSKESEGAINLVNQRIAALDSGGDDWTTELEHLEKIKEQAQKRLDACAENVREAEEEVALAGGALRAVESELRALRLRRDEVLQAAIQHQKDRQAIHAQIAQCEGRLDALNHEEAVRAPRLNGLNEELQRLSRELEGYRERFDEMEESVSVQGRMSSEAQTMLQACEGNWRQTTAALETEELRLRQLSDALKATGSSAASEESLTWLKEKGITIVALTNALKVDEESRPDLERVLGNWINTVAGKMDAKTLKQLPGQLMVSLDTAASKDASIAHPEQTVPLSASVRWQGKTPKVLKGLLSRSFRCTDDEFVVLAAAHPELAFVSSSFVKLPYGPIQVGTEAPTASPLKVQAELDAAHSARETLLERLEAIEAEKKSLADSASGAQERLREMQEDCAMAKRSLEDIMARQVSVQRQIREIEEAQQRADSQWELHEKEIEKLRTRLREMSEAHPEDAGQLLEAEIRTTESRHLEAQNYLEGRREILMEATGVRASAWSERDSAERQFQHMQRAAFNLEAEKKRLTAELAEAEERKNVATGRLEEIERETQNMLDTRLKIAQEQSDVQPEIEQAAEALRIQERVAKEFQESLENARQLRNDSTIQAARVHGNIEAVAKEIELALGLSVSDFMNTITAEEKEAWEQGELVHQTQLSNLESRRLELGSVNPLAIQELEEVEASIGFMNDQRADVIKSVDDIEISIREYNATCEERFREAFDFINLRFQEVFRQVFGGGSAHLSLQDPKDLLECGIEITAQPPGKTARVLTLLSGGEKALAAISLLFAIFHFKPSPFCVLDEVDAPLDEANVGRFAALVKEMKEHTQFIVITHQKPTMIAADTLYGVTMEERGISRLVSVQLREAERFVT